MAVVQATMADTKDDQTRRNGEIRYTSTDCDVIEIREEDTTPGSPEARAAWRKWLEAKYGKKAPAPKPPDGNEDS